MKKILKKKNGKLTSVYAWAVDYSLRRSKERKQATVLNSSKKQRKQA